MAEIERGNNRERKNDREREREWQGEI